MGYDVFVGIQDLHMEPNEIQKVKVRRVRVGVPTTGQVHMLRPLNELTTPDEEPCPPPGVEVMEGFIDSQQEELELNQF